MPTSSDPSSPTGAAAPAPASVLPADAWPLARALVHSRHTVLPRRLGPPGPDAGQLHELLALAAAAPDHGHLVPWRFVIVPPERRDALAAAFEAALRERRPDAGAEDLAAARDKAHRSPVLLLAIALLGPRTPDLPAAERLVSLGAALQNMLLGAHALGFGASLTSGESIAAAAIRALFVLAADEQPVCFVNLGTVLRAKAPARERPHPARFTSTLGED